MTAANQTPHDPPAADGDLGPEQLLGLLARQRDLYKNLKSLSDEQGRLIAEGETERLLTLLAQRQGLIEQLGEVSTQITPHRTSIAALANDDAEPLAGQVRDLVDQVRALLATIIKQDDDGRRDLEAARDDVGSQLRQTAAAPAALGAYGGPSASGGSNPPRFTDQRG